MLNTYTFIVTQVDLFVRFGLILVSFELTRLILSTNVIIDLHHETMHHLRQLDTVCRDFNF